jgi:hypothetical protein
MACWPREDAIPQDAQQDSKGPAAQLDGNRIVVDGTTVIDGLSGGERRPMLLWVQSRLDAGSSPKAIRAQFMGTAASDPTEAPAPDDAFDAAVLEGTVKSVKAALKDGSLDEHLDALEAAEQAGQGRKGVLKAIDARRSTLG